MVGWHHQLDGLEFEQAPGVLIFREAWCAAELDMTKRVNNNRFHSEKFGAVFSNPNVINSLG